MRLLIDLNMYASRTEIVKLDLINQNIQNV